MRQIEETEGKYRRDFPRLPNIYYVNYGGGGITEGPMRNVPAIQEVCEEIERSNCEITAENLDIAIGRTRMPIAKSTFCPLCNKSLLNNKQRQDHLIVEFAKIAGLLALRAARRSKGGVWV